MTLGFLAALFVYTRIIRREVNQQLSVEVNKMVESYVNMANKKKSTGSYSKFESWVIEIYNDVYKHYILYKNVFPFWKYCYWHVNYWKYYWKMLFYIFFRNLGSSAIFFP